MIPRKPSPVPRIQPKPQRLPERNAVTIAAGFVCKEGILICGDREEATGVSKRVVQKVITLMAQPFCLTVANAGSAAVGDLAMKRLQCAFALGSGNGDAFLASNHEQIIVDVLTKLHEDHIWKNPRTDHAIKLIIGLTFLNSSDKFLYVTEDNIPQPVTSYCAVGYGADLCNYFADRLYRSDLNTNELVLLAAFIFREVNASVQFCGKGTDMTFLRPRSLSGSVYPDGVEMIQSRIPEFAEAIKSFWNSLANMPEWVNTIGRASHETKQQQP